jgi:RNA polymerase sigma-70 factor (ECF subfamily)
MDTNELSAVEWRLWLRGNARQFLLFARQQTRCEADAEDVLQEALVETWNRSPNHAPPPLPLVYATIRRRSIDLGRSNDRRTRREQYDDPARPAWFECETEMTGMRDLLESGLKSLGTDQREVVVLKVWSGLTFDEIGSVLEISPHTAASRYRYGIEALRKTLKPLLV